MSKSRWPAEWEPHEATWLAWPHNRDTWPEDLEGAQREYLQFVMAVAEREQVLLLAEPSQIPARMMARLEGLDQVEIVPIATDDAWIRDYGPTVTKDRDGNRQIIDWRFDAWGGKYLPFEQDAAAARELARLHDMPIQSIDRTVEGGAIEANGAGVLLTTRSCLLSSSRNRAGGESALDELLRELLGVTNILWLPGGEISGDDTDGHIDQIARFVAEDRIAVNSAAGGDPVTAECAGANRVALVEQLARLDWAAELIELPLPTPVTWRGDVLPASYVNFYFVNGGLIVPQYGVPEDDVARGILRDALPALDVIGLYCRTLVRGLGAWHCLSQQFPE